GTTLLSGLALAPRVLRSANGTNRTQLSFVLSREARVAVSIYNRAGHRVRELLPASTLPPGAHVVAWDGRDGDAQTVPDGLYIVGITLPDHTTTLPVALTR